MQFNLRETQIIGQGTREWIVHQRECPALETLEIQYAGVTHAAAGFAFCRLTPGISVVFASISGAGKVWVNDRWESCGAGDIYLAPAGAPHAYHVAKGKPWHLCWVAFEERRGRKVLRSDQPRLRRGAGAALDTAILGLYREVHALNDAAATHHWTELIDLGARRLVQERQIDERLLQLWDDLAARLDQPWSLATMAKVVHLSPEQLRHLCQKDFGQSPVEHLTWLRMKRAASLLERTNTKVAAIAGAVGYGNAFAFSTAFRRVIGVSPSEFAQRR